MMKKLRLKKLLCSTISYILIFFTFSAFSISATASGMVIGDFGFSSIWTDPLEPHETGYVINRYIGKDSDVYFPSVHPYTHNDYKVIKMIIQNNYITNAYLPNTMDMLYIGSFQRCPKLTNIYNTQYINLMYFNSITDCMKFERAYFPNVKKVITTAPSSPFNSSNGLKEVYLGECITYFPAMPETTTQHQITAYIPNTVVEGQLIASPEVFKVIYGKSGSYAEKFANENEIPFIAVDVNYVRGDFNYDGEINIGDVTELQQVLVGINAEAHIDETVARWHGNFNTDGSLDIKDATYLQKYLLGLESVI